MGRQLAGVSITMLGCDQRKVVWQKHWLISGQTCVWWVFPGRVPSNGHCTLMIQLKLSEVHKLR